MADSIEELDEKIAILTKAKEIIDEGWEVSYHVNSEDWEYAHSCGACQMMVVLGGIDDAIDFYEWDKKNTLESQGTVTE